MLASDLTLRLCFRSHCVRCCYNLQLALIHSKPWPHTRCVRDQAETCTGIKTILVSHNTQGHPFLQLGMLFAKWPPSSISQQLLWCRRNTLKSKTICSTAVNCPGCWPLPSTRSPVHAQTEGPARHLTHTHTHSHAQKRFGITPRLHTAKHAHHQHHIK